MTRRIRLTLLLVFFGVALGAGGIALGQAAGAVKPATFKLNEKVETIFMMPKETYTFISSRMIKEVARLGGDISSFVPTHVEQALHKKVENGRKVKIA